ncbi:MULTISPECIES: DoxX family protein [unclassified Novosphingobium]|uniref:DoxX family protein n=1 Tax=unclassified Novosphingobium TaxID=2644732 RepID=UPI00135A85DE|nr:MULTISPECIES: DoxX family protein [unclassified Novosphingobium]
MNRRTPSRAVLAVLYAAAGVLHLALPAPFVGIVPSWVPLPTLVVALTGLAEIAGAAGLLQPLSPALRRAAGWGLAAYALCVWPANVQHMLIDMAKPAHGLGLGYHVPRLALQPVLIWWPLWSAGITDWPWRRRPA